MVLEACWAAATPNEHNLLLTLLILFVVLMAYTVLTSCLLFGCCPLRRLVVRHQMSHHRRHGGRGGRLGGPSPPPPSTWLTRVVRTPLEHEWGRIAESVATTAAVMAEPSPTPSAAVVVELTRRSPQRRLSVSPIQAVRV